MPDQPAEDAITRRSTLKAFAAMLALGRSLGLPPQLMAADTRARMEIKYFRSPRDGEPRLLYAEPLAAPVLDALMAGEISEIEIKWYDGRAGLLGSARLPAEVQLKLERLRR